MTRPPVGVIGSDTGRTTSWPAVSTAASATSPMVRPVTVRQSPWSSPASCSRRATRPIPPARYRSVATKRPPGLRSASSGVRPLTRSKSSIRRSTSASRAIASRCRTALVEPPVAATAAIALSRASRVTMRRGRRSFRTRSMTSAPARRQASPFSASIAGTPLALIGETPSSSQTVAIVFAVNCPPQAPGPGQAASSSARSRSPLIRPAACAPTASNTSWIVTSRPSHRPGAIEPP